MKIRHVRRFRVYPGDCLTDPLPSADVLVVGRVLHDWSLDEKRMLLSKAVMAPYRREVHWWSTRPSGMTSAAGTPLGC
jgi:hypothetical protein